MFLLFSKAVTFLVLIPVISVFANCRTLSAVVATFAGLSGIDQIGVIAIGFLIGATISEIIALILEKTRKR